MSDVIAKVVWVTPDEAKHLRATCHFPRQRIITPRNVERLRLEMERRRFVPGTPVFFCRYPNGAVTIVNGNHTLEAIVSSGIPQKLVFIFLEVESEEEAALIYGCFDVHKSRSWNDALRAVGLGDEIAAAARVMPALGVILARFNPGPENVETNTSRQVRFAFMKHYREEAALLHAAIAGAPKPNQRVIQRAAVYAVALETAKYQPSLAIEFWRGTAHDDGLPKHDPRKTLLRWLHGHPVLGAPSSWMVQSRAAALAWNAFSRGESLQYCKPNQAGQLTISGTPWQGKGKFPAMLEIEPEPEEPAEELPDQALQFAGASRVSEVLDFGLFAHAAGLAPVSYASDS